MPKGMQHATFPFFAGTLIEKSEIRKYLVLLGHSLQENGERL